MAIQEPLLTEEMRQRAIGLEGGPSTMEVEKGAIIKFAQAVGDPNPLWSDEAAACKSRYGGLIAPPTFLRSVRRDQPQLPFDVSYQRDLDGGSEWEFFQPIRPGDRITAVTRIADVLERWGQVGPMLLVVRDTTYANQFGEMVAIERNTGVMF